MAAIAKVQSATKGTRNKEIVRRNGVILKTKAFATKTNARTWARRIENDAEALDNDGALRSRPATPPEQSSYRRAHLYRS
jgi:hypothetical protein